jgi:hypothetical protein
MDDEIITERGLIDFEQRQREERMAMLREARGNKEEDDMAASPL